MALGVGAYSTVFENHAPKIAITIDDPNNDHSPLLSPEKRNQAILDALKNHDELKAGLFVCGMRVDASQGRELLKDWRDRGHLIGNHSYSHKNYGSSKMTPDIYIEDIQRNTKLLESYIGKPRLFRFPYLKEGETVEKRDSMRKFLFEDGYRNGHVTIDASDWYINSRMIDKIKEHPDLELAPYREFFLAHIWERISFYIDLADKLFAYPVHHTLLLHHNLLNALFLGELLNSLKAKGCVLVDAVTAYADPIFKSQPSIIPAGESLIWGLAKESGRLENLLRYPGEDGEYEKPKMDALRL